MKLYVKLEAADCHNRKKIVDRLAYLNQVKRKKN